MFKDMNCLLDLNNNEKDRQSQNEDFVEVKDHLSIYDDKEKHTKMDKLNQSENAVKAKDLLTK